MAYTIKAMEEDKFRSAVYESCNFVRLHGWCDQTNDRIAALLALIRADQTSYPAFTQLAMTVLDGVESIEEKLLIFVLLAELGKAPDQIAELMYRHLQGRLTSKDSAFITLHFFRNLSPVPEEITYNITKRNFISFQRAIFEALKISHFESEFDPSHILLFLIQLLCRNNVNEQNRAMLYLLLSRIDIELPPTIEHVVKTAMLNLRDVIREVEQRLEAVLSDPLRRVDLKLEDIQWEDVQPASPPKREKQPQTLAAEISPVSAGAGQLNREAPRQTSSTPKIAVKGTSYAGTYFDAPTAAATVESAVDVGVPPQSLSNPPKPNQSGLNVSPGISAPGFAKLDANNPVPAPQAAPLDLSASLVIPPAQNSQSDVAIESRSQGIKSESAIFTISFSRETSELKAVLQALKALSATEKAVSGIPTSLSQRVEKRMELVGKLGKTLLFSKWGLLFLGLLIVALVLFLIFRTNPATKPVTALVPSGQSQVPVAPPVTNSTDLNSRGSTTIQTMDQSATGKPLIKTEGNQSVWYPRKGDSLWVLYSWIRNTKGLDQPLRNLVKGEWQGFLRQIASLNPGMTFPDSIFPDKPIVIQRLR